MHKCFYLLFLLILSIGVCAFDSSDLVYKNQLLNVSPTATRTPTQTDKSSEIVLDKKVVCLPLEPGLKPFPNNECVDYNATVTVSASKPENDQLKYEYTVSGRRIIGEGTSIVWDLTGAQPGTYEIRVDISDKSNGKNARKPKRFLSLILYPLAFFAYARL